MKKTQAAQMLPELAGKMGQVVEVGQQLTAVSGQIGEVNKKLVDLDTLITQINYTRNLVTQALEEGRAVHKEQARQRYATLKLFEALAASAPDLNIARLEQQSRDEFDATVGKERRNDHQEPA